jgi:hypothetical protein
MSACAEPKCWRELRAELRAMGGAPVRTKGSHEMWRFQNGEMFLVVRNHLADPVPMMVLRRYRRFVEKRAGHDRGSDAVGDPECSTIPMRNYVPGFTDRAPSATPTPGRPDPMRALGGSWTPLDSASDSWFWLPNTLGLS